MTASRDFLRGFADATGLSIDGAEVQWAEWSRQISDDGREFIESQGYKGGALEGNLWAQANSEGNEE
jgi:hypothetical protein